MRPLWLLALIVVGAAGEEPAALPGRVRLSGGSIGYLPGRGYALPAGIEAVAKPLARKGTLDKSVFFFFDVDGNGRFDDLGVDGWALAKMPFLLPLEPTTVIGASSYTWKVEADGSAVSFRREPLPIDEGQRKVLIQFNQWRMMNGLPAVTVDQELSAACMQHCAYMERHGMTHEQEAGKEGASPEGAEAGRRSCLGEEGPIESVHLFYATFYHRLPLIHPGTKAIGVGASARYAAVDGLTRRDSRAWTWPIIVPAPNSFAHPTHFAHEAPDPLPQGAGPAGFPITLTFEGGTVTDAHAELRLNSEKGAELVTYVSSPEAPAHPKRPDNRSTICVIPKAPLAPLATYWVRVRYKLDGAAREHVWRFNTGRAGPRSVLPMR